MGHGIPFHLKEIIATALYLLRFFFFNNRRALLLVDVPHIRSHCSSVLGWMQGVAVRFLPTFFALFAFGNKVRPGYLSSLLIYHIIQWERAVSKYFTFLKNMTILIFHNLLNVLNISKPHAGHYVLNCYSELFFKENFLINITSSLKFSFGPTFFCFSRINTMFGKSDQPIFPRKKIKCSDI